MNFGTSKGCGAYGADWPNGSIVEIDNMKWRIILNHGNSGLIEDLDKTMFYDNFPWESRHNKAILISKPEKPCPIARESLSLLLTDSGLSAPKFWVPPIDIKITPTFPR